MYVLLTSQSDGTFNLPILWTGKRFNKNLFDILGYTLSRDAIRNGTSQSFGIFNLTEPSIPTGKIPNGSKEDTFDGTTVTRKAPWADDPTYNELDLRKAQAVKDIKAHASNLILEIAPEWKQRNILAGMIKDTATDAETTMWANIDIIRSQSDIIELSVADMTLEDITSFNVSLDSLWIPEEEEEEEETTEETEEESTEEETTEEETTEVVPE